MILRAVIMSLACLTLGRGPAAQTITGRVLDDSTGANLPHVRIGIEGRNLGTVSDERGRYTLDLETAGRDDRVSFARTGYRIERVPLRDLRGRPEGAVRLRPVFATTPLSVALSAGTLKQTGRSRTVGPKRATGQSACGQPATGSEIGLAVESEGKLFGLTEVSFELGEVTYDSLLFRMHVYGLTDDRVGEPLLRRELFARAVAGDTRVSVDVSRAGLLFERDVLVSVEAVRGFAASKGGRAVCYAVGAGGPAEVFVRRSSMDAWRVDAYPTIMLNVELQRYK